MKEAAAAAKPEPTPVNEDVETFIDPPANFITTIEGERIKVKRASLGKETQIVYLVRDILKKLVESGVLGGSENAQIDPKAAVAAAQAQVRIQERQASGDDPDEADLQFLQAFNQKVAADNMRTLTKVLEEVMTDGPDKLIQASCILLEKDKQWVLDNLDLEEVLGFLLPWLWDRRQRIGNKLTKVLGGLQLPGIRA